MSRAIKFARFFDGEEHLLSWKLWGFDSAEAFTGALAEYALENDIYADISRKDSATVRVLSVKGDTQ